MHRHANHNRLTTNGRGTRSVSAAGFVLRVGMERFSVGQGRPGTKGFRGVRLCGIGRSHIIMGVPQRLGVPQRRPGRQNFSTFTTRALLRFKPPSRRL